MRKRILIVSSEHLSPGCLLDSTFELSQAQILQERFDVAILSVRVHTAAIRLFLSLSKSILLLYPVVQIKKRFLDLIQSAVYLFRGRRTVCKKWIIDGVSVYEGHCYPLWSSLDGAKQEKNWVDAAFEASGIFVKDNGKPNLLHAHGRFLIAGVFAEAYRRKEGVEYVYTEHSSRFPSGFVPVESIPSLNRVIDHCKVYIAVSRPLMHKVEETLDREILHGVVIPNVVDRIFQAPILPSPDVPPFVFIDVINLEHRKGADILLRAFKRAFHADPMVRLKIVGDGPQSKELKLLSRYLGLEQLVEFVGLADKHRVLHELEQSHVFVFPSRFETFGVAVTEAMARGLPVIATRCGGPEYTVKKEQGLLIDPEHEDQLVEAMIQMKENYSCYERTAIHDYALNRFGSATFVDYMTAVYDRHAS